MINPIDKGEVDIICTDYEKAFNKVPHGRVIFNFKKNMALTHYILIG